MPKSQFRYSMKYCGKALWINCQEGKIDLQKFSERRKKATPETILLCDLLKKSGFKAELEKWDGYKHIDIAIPQYMVNIEVDGLQHHNETQALADLKRTYYSFKKGYITLRIPNSLLQPDIIIQTSEYIKKFLIISEEQLDNEDDDWNDD